MQPTDRHLAPPWRHSLLALPVWKRGACYGLPAGLLQAAMNQGDFWIHGNVTPIVALKTTLSPLIGFAVAFVSAAATHRESLRLQLLHGQTSPPTAA